MTTLLIDEVLHAIGAEYAKQKATPDILIIFNREGFERMRRDMNYLPPWMLTPDTCYGFPCIIDANQEQLFKVHSAL